ncbi:hypothetical protein QNI19_28040 [Cytophagaceae bacterium DM2B3-1]|uniref:TMhelix containing protein n=1 Tax=Xanthocytophaga flava TaxID=3048013 RepID=A0ABT7CSS6_9BACT|nr:hypothetical protein [Xanthocytophaga flavus]MDJ1496818.1 hypothetical protein [Xanthocytophaga flavus]
MKTLILVSALCFVTSVALGVFTEHRLNPTEVYACEVIDYNQIEAIVAKHAVAPQIQPLDVEKIKHVRQFTYAPVFCVKDTCNGR